MSSDYTKGLHEIGDGCFAWLEPDGSWGWSNAGLVVGDGASILVDTLFDVPLTRNMLDGMKGGDRRPARSRRCSTRTPTATTGSATSSSRTPRSSPPRPPSPRCRPHCPDRLEALRKPCRARPATSLARSSPRSTGPTSRPRCPTRTFDGRLDLDIGGIEVQLIELGPAHTAGDTIAYVPSARTIFTGDLLFIGGTPIIWAGPLSNWVAACDVMLELDADRIVPGHGPITDRDGIRQVRDYLTFVDEQARARYAAGMSAEEAIADIALGEFGKWAEHGRIAQNVLAVYYELDPTIPHVDVLSVFGKIAELEGFTDDHVDAVALITAIRWSGAARDLADCVARQLVDHLDAVRHLVVGEALTGPEQDLVGRHVVVRRRGARRTRRSPRRRRRCGHRRRRRR